MLLLKTVSYRSPYRPYRPYRPPSSSLRLQPHRRHRILRPLPLLQPQYQSTYIALSTSLCLASESTPLYADLVPDSGGSPSHPSSAHYQLVRLLQTPTPSASFNFSGIRKHRHCGFPSSARGRAKQLHRIRDKDHCLFRYFNPLPRWYVRPGNAILEIRTVRLTPQQHSDSQ